MAYFFVQIRIGTVVRRNVNENKLVFSFLSFPWHDRLFLGSFSGDAQPAPKRSSILGKNVLDI